MSRTRRRRHWGEKGTDRDGTIRAEGQILPKDFDVEVIRRERREREAEADRLAKGDIDADDTPTKPMRKRLWQLWRRF